MEEAIYKIVMVDDDEEDIFTIRKGFKNSRLRIDFTAFPSAVALDDHLNDASSDLPHLILLDINIPRKNGFEVLEELQRHPTFSEIPVIVLSTSSREADRIKSKALGAEGLVTKFSSMKALGQWVTKLEAFLSERYQS